MARRISRRAKVGRAIRRAAIGALPDFVPPQLTALTEAAPEGGEWAHELKWDGYRMHARIEGRNVRLLTRTGLDWTDKYPPIVKALRALPVGQAYLDGGMASHGGRKVSLPIAAIIPAGAARPGPRAGDQPTQRKATLKPREEAGRASFAQSDPSDSGGARSPSCANVGDLVGRFKQGFGALPQDARVAERLDTPAPRKPRVPAGRSPVASPNLAAFARPFLLVQPGRIGAQRARTRR